MIALVEADTSRRPAAAVGADGCRRIERIQVVEIVAAVARSPSIPQW